jgi:hypothetical protein
MLNTFSFAKTYAAQTESAFQHACLPGGEIQSGYGLPTVGRAVGNETNEINRTIQNIYAVITKPDGRFPTCSPISTLLIYAHPRKKAPKAERNE